MIVGSVNSREPASPVGFDAAPVVLLLQHAQLVVEARHRRSRTVRKPMEQETDFHIVEHTPLAECPAIKQRIRAR